MDFREQFLKAYYAKGGNRIVPERPVLPLLELDEAFRISIINQKGGCGKTTTTINLASYLVEMGYSVLLVDSDPQAHLTLGLGLQGDSFDLTIYHLLLRSDLSATRVIQPTYHRNLKLIPSNGLLAAAQVELLNLQSRDSLLKNKLGEVKRFFHFILIDCPPTLNLLTLNALTASMSVIIPIQTQYYSLDGMRELFKTLELVRQNSNPDLEILGILPTLFDGRTKLNRAMLHAIREYFQGQVFETVIHLSSALAECPMMGQSIATYAPGSPGARDYRCFTEEVITRAARSNRSFERSQETV